MQQAELVVIPRAGYDGLHCARRFAFYHLVDHGLCVVDLETGVTSPNADSDPERGIGIADTLRSAFEVHFAQRSYVWPFSIKKIHS